MSKLTQLIRKCINVDKVSYHSGRGQKWLYVGDEKQSYYQHLQILDKLKHQFGGVKLSYSESEQSTYVFRIVDKKQQYVGSCKMTLKDDVFMVIDYTESDWDVILDSINQNKYLSSYEPFSCNS